MSDYKGFSIVVQFHDQPPINSPAYRPRLSKEFMPGMNLSEVWEWIEDNQVGDIESVEIIRIT